jgi:ClpP class serine protease
MLLLAERGLREAIAKAPKLSAMELKEHAPKCASGWGLDSLYSVSGSNGFIKIEGLLSPKPDVYAKLYFGGNTVYGDIIEAIRSAENNSSVKEIVLAVNSGGGYFDGVTAVADAIYATKKPVKAIVYGMACSAAYLLAAQADSIEAKDRSAIVGSIGTAMQLYAFDFIIDVANTDSPNKRPDPKTEEGMAVIQGELDEITNIFYDAVSRGRSVSVDHVKTNYGRGGIILAERALDIGMIDMIQSTESTSNRRAGGTKEVTAMNLAQLKAEHPDVYASAVQVGVAEERDRVNAHLKMGEASGAMDVASAAIKNGDGMTASLQADYLAAGMNRRDTQNRADDDASAGKAANGAAAQSEDEDDTVANIVAKKFGLEVK